MYLATNDEVSMYDNFFLLITYSSSVTVRSWPFQYRDLTSPFTIIIIIPLYHRLLTDLRKIVGALPHEL